MCIRDRVNTAINLLVPGKRPMRGAAKNLIYNRGYYKEEITTLVNSQFGSGIWNTDYDTWLDSIVTNLSHDLITTDITDSTVAHDIILENVDLNFQVGELITSQGSNGSAVVLEFSNDTKKLTVGKWYGTPWEGNDKLDGTRSGAAADVAIKGCLLYTSPSPRDRTRSRMPSSA